MDKCLSLLPTHLRIGIAEDEPDGGEEVALARSIAPNYNVEFGRKWVDDGLIFVAAILINQCLSGGHLDRNIPLEALYS